MKRMNQEKENKHHKLKKREPLKVVYISNPKKFKATASEFMALVQELTGQDADDTPESPTFTADEGGDEAAKVAEEDNFHARILEKEVGHPDISYGAGQEGSDPSTFGSFNDLFLCPEMIGFVGSNLVDVLKNLDAAM